MYGDAFISPHFARPLALSLSVRGNSNNSKYKNFTLNFAKQPRILTAIQNLKYLFLSFLKMLMRDGCNISQAMFDLYADLNERAQVVIHVNTSFFFKLFEMFASLYIWH